MDIAEKKASLRGEIRAKRRALTDEERAGSSRAVAEKLVSLKPIASAEYVLAYMPMKYELDILPAVEALKGMGKKLVFPLCVKNGGLKLYLPAAENGFRTGAYGILEPVTETAEEVEASKLDVIILPAIGFDRELNRLGQGGGYYDRLLERTDCVKIAVGFDCQLVESVPVEPFDRPVDAVITPSAAILNKDF